MAKTIKNSMVTSEQYDKLQVDLVNRIEELEGQLEGQSERFDRLDSDYDLVKRNYVEYANWSHDHRTLMKSTIKARGYWIAGLATLSLVQTVALVLTNL